MNRFYNLTVNQLTFRTFMVFWLTFIVLSLLLITLPYLDSRIYVPLKENEIADYQQKLVSTVKTNRLNRLLSSAVSLPIDKFDEEHPVLYDAGIEQSYGIYGNEGEYVHHFFTNLADSGKPQRKAFSDIQIVGPFQVYLNNGEKPLFLFFVSKINPQREILQYMLDKPHILFALMIVITTPLLFWFARTIIKPIANLQRSANAISLGSFKLNPRLNVEGPLELRQVGQSFNRMVSSINNLLSHQQSLLSSISHELRTPLTRLQLANALLRRQVGENDESVKRIEKEIERMDKMVNDLLILSKQHINSHTKREIIPLPRLWENVLKDAQFEAEQRQIDFDVSLKIHQPHYFMLNGNLDLLASAVENVVRNALKYTQSKICIGLSLSQVNQEKYLLIQVDDNGGGVPKDKLRAIFKPFYRVDETRTRTTGGAGLGLAIVASIITEHQGKVWAEKSPLGGLSVNIRLPLWINA